MDALSSYVSDGSMPGLRPTRRARQLILPKDRRPGFLDDPALHPCGLKELSIDTHAFATDTGGTF
jgi:hypothetical protein